MRRPRPRYFRLTCRKIRVKMAEIPKIIDLSTYAEFPPGISGVDLHLYNRIQMKNLALIHTNEKKEDEDAKEEDAQAIEDREAWWPEFEDPRFDYLEDFDEENEEEEAAKEEIHLYYGTKLNSISGESLNIIYDLMKCGVCAKYPEKLNFKMCFKGHRFCEECMSKDSCPQEETGIKCKERVLDMQCSVYNEFFKVHKFPCIFPGCEREVVGPELEKHRSICTYRQKYSCPYQECQSEDLFSTMSLMSHLTSEHQVKVIEDYSGEEVQIPWGFSRTDNALEEDILDKAVETDPILYERSKSVIGAVLTVGDDCFLLLLYKFGGRVFFRVAILEERESPIISRLIIIDAEGEKQIWTSRAFPVTDSIANLIEHGHCLCIYSEAILTRYIICSNNGGIPHLRLKVSFPEK